MRAGTGREGGLGRASLSGRLVSAGVQDGQNGAQRHGSGSPPLARARAFHAKAAAGVATPSNMDMAVAIMV